MSLEKQAVEEFKNNNFNESLQLLKKFIETNPNSYEAYNFLGIVYLKLKKHDFAKNSWEKAFNINANYIDPLINIANLFIQGRKLEIAISYLNKALLIEPENFKLSLMLGNTYMVINKFEKALENLNSAIKINPNNFEPYYLKGLVYNNMNKLEDAIKNFNLSLSFNQSHQDSLYSLAVSYREIKNFIKSKKIFTKLYELNNNYNYLLGSIFFINNRICNWDNYEENLELIKNKILNNKKCITPWAALSIFDSPEIQMINTKIYTDFENTQKKEIDIKKNTDEKINIGYFSGNFCNHAVAFQINKMLQQHNTKKFNIYLFNFKNSHNNLIKNEYKNIKEIFNVSDLSDPEIVNISKKIKIDIAIDLMGFTRGNRFNIFKQRCAPLQVNFLGYAGTSAIRNMDYLIADSTVVNISNRQFFTENIIFMPNSFMVNNDDLDIDNINFKRSGLKINDNNLIFCSLNKNYKINPKVFSLWMKILKKVDNSILLLNYADDVSKYNILENCKNFNVSKQKIKFLEYTKSYNEYLSKIKNVDIFLDTFPYSAHSTGSSALWCGVPIITKSGNSFTSNVASSMLKALNLEELITTNDEEYINLAVSMAKNKEILKKVKLKLKNNKISKLLFNTKKYTTNIEKAFENIYSLKCKNKKLVDLEVDKLL